MGSAALQVVRRSRCNKNKNPHLNSTRREGSMRLVSVWKVSGLCLVSGRCLEDVWRMSGMCLEGIRRVSGRFLEDFWRVDKGCSEGV